MAEIGLIITLIKIGNIPQINLEYAFKYWKMHLLNRKITFKGR